MLLAFVPVPHFVDPLWVRIGMLAAAIALPLVVGIAILFMLEPSDRPTGMDAARLVLRGYPLTAALAITLVFLAVMGVARKGAPSRSAGPTRTSPASSGPARTTRSSPTSSERSTMQT